MLADKRTVTTDALETLGTIIDNSQKRDAIHLAVEPVIAGEKLLPGQDVGLKNGFAITNAKHLGIVDPFLKESVSTGEYFWLIVYPRQINSLRHVWTHPDFPESGYRSNIKLMVKNNEISDSEQWVCEYAHSLGHSYEELMNAATEWIKSGGNKILHVYELEGDMICDEFWDYYEAITNIRIPDKLNKNFFYCTC